MSRVSIGQPLATIPGEERRNRLAWRAGHSKYELLYRQIRQVAPLWLPVTFDDEVNARRFVNTAITHRLERYDCSRSGTKVWARYRGEQREIRR